MKKIKIETKRLILRPWKIEDAKAWVNITKQKEVIKWIANVKYNISIKEAKKLIKDDERKRTAIYLAIADKENKNVMGSIWFRNIDEEHDRKLAELGILLRKEFWNKGYATEACKSMIDFGFKKLRLLKIYAKVNEENSDSKNLIKNLGFKFEGNLRKEAKIRFQNKWCNDLYYGLLKNEWNGSK